MLQQCLACNALITGSSRSCVCGHVLEDATRFIEGKRFSEYRAMLYSRLENRRMKNKEAKENTKERPRKQLQPLRELKNQMPAVLTEHPTFKPTRKRRSKVSRATNKTPKKRKELSQVLKQPRQQSSAVPQELLTRFPSALQRINQKIMAQNMVWLALQLE
ncbi:unnamed protein product [Porites lobata]|uniref:Uncharacterized protein n=1 Tax=Porites lobata TaxID=104759 RepID=A0ABN8N602_9CNID|nr:unnamed protein product [Porites lobata]